MLQQCRMCHCRAACIAILFLLMNTATTVTSFAAKKRRSSRKAPGGNNNNKGFGNAKPLPNAKTFQQLLSSIPTRKPPSTDEISCPCGSGDLYDKCCGRYIDQNQPLETPEATLRSRYTAFSWRIPQHIIATTHESCRDYQPDKIQWLKDLNKNGMFDSFEFCKLDILNQDKATSNQTILDFSVMLKSKETNEEFQVSECSRFVRDKDKKPSVWFYAGGQVRSNVDGLEEIVLNP